MNLNGPYSWAELAELSGVPESRLRVLYHLHEPHSPDTNPQFWTDDIEFYRRLDESRRPGGFMLPSDAA